MGLLREVRLPLALAIVRGQTFTQNKDNYVGTIIIIRPVKQLAKHNYVYILAITIILAGYFVVCVFVYTVNTNYVCA